MALPTLKSQRAWDAVNIHLNEDEFAETGIYEPRTGGQRTIKVVVDRDFVQIVDGVPMASVGVLAFNASNSSETGIATTELDTGGDSIWLAEYEGGKLVKMAITRRIESDSAMLLLEACYGANR